jgi:Ca-activated chloride channel family protein
MLRLLPDVFQRAGDRWRVKSRGTAAILSPRAGLFISVFLISLGLSAIPSSGHAQFTSGVSLVEVYATVVDQRGEPVEGLTQDDFTVEEDGHPQRTETFAAGDVPLSLAIAVDRSFSLSAGRLNDTVVATRRLLGELRPEDRVTLLALGSEVQTLTPLSNDHRAAYDALGGLDPWGTTPLYDATLAALNAIQGAAGRRALILISDGSDRYSTTSAAAMVAEARRRDVMIYPVALNRAPPPVFVELAAVTGGRSTIAPDARTLSSGLSSIARELRHQYLIGYVPPHDVAPDGWRSIAVKVRRPGLRVRARDGYYAGRDKG